MTRSTLACLLAALALAGCERAMHNMYEQPRYDPGEPSSLFDNGSANRPPPTGSVRHTLCRGTMVYDQGEIRTAPGHGR